MSSPLIDLQQHVLDREVPVSTLVRYALLIAKKIKDDQMTAWCTDELNGYTTKPDGNYRIAHGEYMATDEWGRDLPIVVRDPKMLDIVTKVPLFMSVGDLEDMLSRADNESSWKMYLPSKLEADLKKGMRPPVQRLFRVVQQQQLAQVLEAVRNKLFDWTIDLQMRGVQVEGDFPTLPQRKGKSVVESTRTIQTNNYVEVRDAMQSPVQVGGRSSPQQTTYHGVDLSQVSGLIEALERDLIRLQPRDPEIQKLIDEVETLRNVLKSPTPKHSWVREGLGSIKHILENAAGTVLGEALKDAPYVVQIARMLGMS